MNSRSNYIKQIGISDPGAYHLFVRSHGQPGSGFRIAVGDQVIENDLGDDQPRFVAWLRQVAPYIHAFRGKTFVVAVPGELIQAGRLNALVQDLSLLHAMGMRIVVAHGSRPQVNEQLRLRVVEAAYAEGLRITGPVALECAKEASGEIRLDLEAAFSQGLPNTPMAYSAVRVLSVLAERRSG